MLTLMHMPPCFAAPRCHADAAGADAASAMPLLPLLAPYHTLFTAFDAIYVCFFAAIASHIFRYC